jgi:hypothetical protein
MAPTEIAKLLHDTENATLYTSIINYIQYAEQLEVSFDLKGHQQATILMKLLSVWLDRLPYRALIKILKFMRKIHNEELHNLYSSPNIIRMIQSRRVKWAGHVGRMGGD